MTRLYLLRSRTFLRLLRRGRRALGHGLLTCGLGVSVWAACRGTTPVALANWLVRHCSAQRSWRPTEMAIPAAAGWRHRDVARVAAPGDLLGRTLKNLRRGHAQLTNAARTCRYTK